MVTDPSAQRIDATSTPRTARAHSHALALARPRLAYVVLHLVFGVSLGASLGALAGCAAQRPTPVAPAATAFPEGATPPSGRDPATIPPPIAIPADGAAVIGTSKATIFDSRKVATQIDRRAVPGPQRRPGSLLPEHRRPPIEKGSPNGLAYGMQGTAQRNDVDPAFPGIGATVWTPPDPYLAVGPSHIVATVNMKIAWYLKNGTAQFENFLDSSGNPGFFEEIGGGAFTFDPKCFYDEHTGRFLVLALEFYSATNESWITIAVSDDSDPNGVWFKYRTPAVVELASGCRYWIDYPGLGYDGQAWYVTGNLFSLSSNPAGCAGFGGTLVRVFEKPGAMTGGTAVWRDVVEPSASWQVASARRADDAARLVSVNNSTSLAIIRVNNPLTAPTLAKSVCPVPLMVADGSAPTPVGSLSLVDRRIFNAAVRNGRVFAGNHAAAATNGDASAIWYEIDVSAATPTLVQSGRIAAIGGEHTFFPALAVNDSGSMALVYGRSSATLHPTIEVAGRVSCDATGTLGASTVVASSTTSPGGNNPRWGDYFGAAVDPADGSTFWVIGERQIASGWTTEIVSFRVGRAGDLNGDNAVNSEDLGVLLSAWGACGSGTCPADINNDGVVDSADLGQLLSGWGPCAN